MIPSGCTLVSRDTNGNSIYLPADWLDAVLLLLFSHHLSAVVFLYLDFSLSLLSLTIQHRPFILKYEYLTDKNPEIP